MTIHVPPPRFTSSELERLVRTGGFGGARVELRRGMIVKMHAQHFPASDVIIRMIRAMDAALARAGTPLEVHTGVSVDFAVDFQPLPDLVVWDRAAAPAPLVGPLPGSAARLVVEVSDTTLADDLGEKLEDYAKAGLPEYWVADVRGRLILRHAEPEGAGYARREPALFGAPAAWLTRPEIVVETTTLT